MKKDIFVILCCLIFSSIEAQTEDTSSNSVLRSSIIDHSGVQAYIEAHAMIEKKKPFFEGFRIQIYSGNNKEEANKVKAEFYTKFPNMRCYLTYQQPYYKLRVGDYENQESAKADAKRLVRTYPSSFLVPDQVRRTTSDDPKEKTK